MLIKAHEIQQVSNEMLNMLHEDELKIANEFYDAVVARDIEQIDELIKTFLLEAEAHYGTEEEMMKLTDFKDFDLHKKDHDLMREKLMKYFTRWFELKGPKELQGFLETEYKPWLVTHVAKWDSEAARHI